MATDTRRSPERVRDEITNEARRVTGRDPVPTGPQKDSIRPSDSPASAVARLKDEAAETFDINSVRDSMRADRAAKNKMDNMREVDDEVATERSRRHFKNTMDTLQNAVNPKGTAKYAKGGAVRGCGAATKGHGKGTMR